MPIHAHLSRRRSRERLLQVYKVEAGDVVHVENWAKRLLQIEHDKRIVEEYLFSAVLCTVETKSTFSSARIIMELSSYAVIIVLG